MATLLVDRDRTAARSVALAPLVLLCAMHPLTVSMLAPAAAGIAEGLALPHGAVSATFTAFMLAAALGQVLFGPLSDLFGRRPVLAGGLVVFAAGSLLCAAATGWAEFTAGRLLQAAGGVGLVTARAIVRDTCSGSEVTRRLAVLAGGMALVTVAAPVLGGIASDGVGWRGVCLGLAMVGIAALGLVPTLRELPGAARKPAFAFARYRSEAAELASLPRFWLCTGALAALGVAYFAIIAGGAAFAAAHGLPLVAVGVAAASVSAGCFAGTVLSQRLVPVRPGVDTILLGSLISILAVAGVALCVLLQASPSMLVAPLLLLGIGNGVALPQAIAAGIGMRPRLAGTAAGILGAAQILGGAAAGAAVSALNLIAACRGTALAVLLPMLAGTVLFLAFGRALRSERGSLPALRAA